MQARPAWARRTATRAAASRCAGNRRHGRQDGADDRDQLPDRRYEREDIEERNVHQPQGECGRGANQRAENQLAGQPCADLHDDVLKHAGKACPPLRREQPYDPVAQVWTAWDLGIADATAIWFAQVVGREVHVIDYYETSGADLGHYVREIVRRPYVYGGHIVPHDAQAKELGTGKSRLEVLASLGLKGITVAPSHRVEDGINAVRAILPICEFDAQACAEGISMLKSYRKEWDEIRGCWKDRPRHDMASHGADAFRYLAAAYRDLAPPPPVVDKTPKVDARGIWVITPDDLKCLMGRSDRPRV